MMIKGANPRDAVRAALQEQTSISLLPEANEFVLSLSNGLVLEGSVKVEDLWLTLALRMPEEFSHLDRVWKLLGHNALTGQGVKFALGMQATCPQLRGEVSLAPANSALLNSRIDATCQAMKQAVEQAYGLIVLPPEDGTAETGPSVEQLLKLCDEANWLSTISAGGNALVVKLESQRFPCQAQIASRNGHILVATEWASIDTPLIGEVQKTLGIFLLTVSGAIRLVSTALVNSDERSVIWAQVVLHTDANAAELGHALSALSVASRNCGAEVSLLLQADLAKAFLRGRSLVVTASV